MKTIRFLLLALFAALLAACSNDPPADLPSDPRPDDPPAAADPHKVPVEKALGELEELLQAIDGPETRSGGARRVASVEALGASALARATRAGDDAAAAAEIGDLVYIANFQNGEGYAILGADDRIESVIAVTERGSLTPEQLAAAADGQYDGADAPPVVPEIGDYLIERIGGIHKYDSLIGGGTGSNIRDLVIKKGRTEFLDRKGPYCKMKWGQGAPYNLSTPVHSGQHCMVGCVAVALGQIVATNYYDKYYPMNMNPDPQVLGGRTIHWDAIFKEIKRYNDFPWAPKYYDSKTEVTNTIESVADLLSGIGISIGMDYGLDGSSASNDSACRFLRAVGFTNVDKYYLDAGKLKEMVIDRGLPTYITGHDDNVDKGHAWVVDGAAAIRQHSTITNRKTGEVKETYMDLFLYHCNFG